MGKLFCLMGKSSTGKDTIFKYLKEDRELDLRAVTPYTTRPKRENEVDGVEYYFIDENKLEEFKDKNKVIELRCYETVMGKWYYGTIDDGQVNLKKNNYIVIVTLEAYNNLKKYFGEKNVVPLYIAVDDGVRLERALNRERQQLKPNYNEMCRRFLADDNDFSIDKLKSSNIEKIYSNDSLKICVTSIKKDISQILTKDNKY
ncbi:guanylate kinase [Clostridium sp. 19966]|uniref:guanylate kinase n=1 Tax=Clostridium sp. 19966 TaxID=2768166 RepID=UPI0028DE83FB|nr:guanylate kinase [Clostridium sp. 19966]MDT8715777.1 guanylate kinase [Clostridium sp. 19966]